MACRLYAKKNICSILRRRTVARPEEDCVVNPSRREPVIVVSEAERAALTTAAAFFTRSGTTIASQLLSREQPAQNEVLLVGLRDQLLSTSLLCRVLGGLDD